MSEDDRGYTTPPAPSGYEAALPPRPPAGPSASDLGATGSGAYVPQDATYGPSPAGGYGPPAGGYGPPGGAYDQPRYAPPAQHRTTNSLAVVSIVMSLIGFFPILPVAGSIVGIITGHLAISQIHRSGQDGMGVAKAGAIIGWIGLLFWVLGTIALIMFLSQFAEGAAGA